MKKYLKELSEYKKIGVFNPWGDWDELYDKNENCPKIRLNNLKLYLEARRNPKFILIAEALSFNGGHFSGIAMTSERQLLADNLMFDERIFTGEKLRTSCPKKLKNLGLNIQANEGFCEPTGSIVWNTLSKLMDTYDWVNWNTYPFHPFDDKILSNRIPNKQELTDGKYFLNEFLKMYDDNVKIISIGNTSENMLKELGKNFVKVRHPANGGAVKFKQQINNFLKAKD